MLGMCDVMPMEWMFVVTRVEYYFIRKKWSPWHTAKQKVKKMQFGK